MYCPKCKTLKLKQATVKDSGGVKIDYCSQCKGFWLDKGEFEKVSQSAIKELSLPPEAERISRLCPLCQEFMYSFDYPQTLVTIEMCKTCKGLWIDAGELKEIEMVRNNLKKTKQFKEYDDVWGVKGTLINFIENAIKHLLSCSKSDDSRKYYL